MNGYSSHTYSWLNASDELFWVKYHFKTDQGIDFLTQEDADRLAGEDGDYHQRDLFTSIEDGNFPSWTLHVQIMPFEDAKTYRFNPFDLTKVWPHGDYPLHEVGRMTLNRNVEDYHAQIEQAAFEPNNIVPGTGLSPDKMLLARGFSYSDAHRARLGVNYKQIPVNEPHVEVRAYSKDGAMRIRNATDPVYTPNSMGGPEVDPKRAAEVHWASDGDMVRTAYALRADDDDWGQAGTMVREVLDDEARDRLANNIIGHVLDGVREPVLSRVFEYWTNVDPDLGKKVEEGVRAKHERQRRVAVTGVLPSEHLAGMIKPMSIEVVFTAESTATGGGRDGHVKSSTGRIDLDTDHPKEMGGNGEGTNPEELFSAGYAACFLGALRRSQARRRSSSTMRAGSPPRSDSGRIPTVGSPSTPI